MANKKSRKQVYEERKKQAVEKSKLTKAVNRYNEKRAEFIKEYPEFAEYQPPKLNSKDLLDVYKTTEDIKKETRSVERYLKPGAEQPINTLQGIKTTKYEKKEAQIKTNAINTKRRSERKKADISTEKGTMGSIRANNLQDKIFDLDNMTPKEWEKFKASLDKQFMASYNLEKMKLYKENYLNTVKDILGEKGTELYKLVQGLDPKLIYDNFYNDPILQIGFISDPLPAEDINNAAVAHWNNALK